jgi:hypothetical protein
MNGIIVLLLIGVVIQTKKVNAVREILPAKMSVKTVLAII